MARLAAGFVYAWYSLLVVNIRMHGYYVAARYQNIRGKGFLFKFPLHVRCVTDVGWTVTMGKKK